LNIKVIISAVCSIFTMLRVIGSMYQIKSLVNILKKKPSNYLEYPNNCIATH